MTEEVTIRPALFPDDLARVRKLCWDYRDHLLSGGDVMRYLTEVFYPEAVYTRLMDELPVKYADLRHGVLLAERGDKAIGCGMYHPLTADDAEIKRVFVTKDGRGHGTGEALSRALIEEIRRDGYARIFLDTNPDFTAARRLYEKLGFQRRGPYSDMAEDVAAMLVFYELIL